MRKRKAARKSACRTTIRSRRKPARATVAQVRELGRRARVDQAARRAAPETPPKPATPVLMVEKNASVLPAGLVVRTDSHPRSEATRLGSKAVGYLRRHARHPYGVRGCEGIVLIARQAWRAALIELEVAA